ncbi:MAG: hypothetical protein M1817_005621 [Caeruleum heppii]|nr:MAG: hypothetical protein M1817_005621 [Caeruleum heppii]
MSAWLAEYSRALRVRDRREKANLELYQSHTRLADRTAALEALSAIQIDRDQETSSSDTKGLNWGPAAKPPPSASPLPGDAVDQMRRDLAEAQRTKVALEARIKQATVELHTLQAKSAIDDRRIAEVSRQRNTADRRVRDRDEELKGKAKLLESVQDELVSLNLQLNMAENRTEELRTENEQLVRRWMERKGLEADEMNRASKFS